MKKIVYVSLMLSILLSISCDKNKSCKTLLAAPVVTNNSPVNAGDTVILSIPNIENTTCNWNGPFPFHSDSNSIAIVAYDTNLGGTFNVQYFTQDCLSDLATAAVVINPPVIPCTYSKNRSEIPGWWTILTFTDIHFSSSDDSINYSFAADAGSGDNYILLHFTANLKPQNGVYTVTDNYNPGFGEVYIHLKLSDEYVYIPEGKVYINTVNGKRIATWCDLPCYFVDGFVSTITGNLTDP
jgi:hypothetical protein